MIMTKFTDLLKTALDKKKGQHHIENDDGAKVDTKSKSKPAKIVANKPQKKVTGRGR